MVEDIFSVYLDLVGIDFFPALLVDAHAWQGRIRSGFSCIAPSVFGYAGVSRPGPFGLCPSGTN